MSAPSFDIKDMLEADVLVDTNAFPIYRGAMPEDVPNCTVIVDVPGGSPQLTMENAKYQFPSVQIKVRCTDYDEGWAHIDSIETSLHGRAHETWNGSYYSLLQTLNGPGFNERENQRSIFVYNVNIQRR